MVGSLLRGAVAKESGCEDDLGDSGSDDGSIEVGVNDGVNTCGKLLCAGSCLFALQSVKIIYMWS